MNKFYKYIISGLVAFATIIGSAMYADVDEIIPDGPHRVFGGVGLNHDASKLDGKNSGNPFEAILGYEFQEDENMYIHLRMIWTSGKMKGLKDSKAILLTK